MLSKYLPIESFNGISAGSRHFKHEYQSAYRQYIDKSVRYWID